MLLLAVDVNEHKGPQLVTMQRLKSFGVLSHELDTHITPMN